jgi:ribosomal RNA-processing protein 1
MASDIQQAPFVKELAANGISHLLIKYASFINASADRPTRDKAVHSLRTFLSGRRELPSLELLKLWKGLFYCMWMSDRARTQQALADSLADLVSVLPQGTVIPFLRAFWQTMQREWTNIDVLRMEKFLLLTRRYLGATFQALERGNWAQALVREHMDLLLEIPCNVEDMRIPNGMRFHVIDIYVDELERVRALESEEDRPVELLLEPLRRLAKDSPTKPVRTKAKDALGDERLPGNEKADEEAPAEEGDDTWDGIED